MLTCFATQCRPTGQVCSLDSAEGKRLFISCVEARDVEFFLAHLNPLGLSMIVDTANEEESQRM